MKVSPPETITCGSWISCRKSRLPGSCFSDTILMIALAETIGAGTGTAGRLISSGPLYQQPGRIAGAKVERFAMAVLLPAMIALWAGVGWIVMTLALSF